MVKQIYIIRHFRQTSFLPLLKYKDSLFQDNFQQPSNLKYHVMLPVAYHQGPSTDQEWEKFDIADVMPP